MNWKRWKIGLLVSILTGIATAFAVGLVIPTMTLKQGLFVLAGSIGKDLLLFLNQNQVKDISFDTSSFKQQNPNNPNPNEKNT